MTLLELAQSIPLYYEEYPFVVLGHLEGQLDLVDVVTISVDSSQNLYTSLSHSHQLFHSE
jgi:hypothetical protein